jgi:hypothetical protein
VGVELGGDALVDGGDGVDGSVGEGREVVHLEVYHCWETEIEGVVQVVM